MLKIYNSLTHRKEELKPIEEGVVKMYTCGPTVYYFPHIGNMRAYLFMDSIRRVLKYDGYKVVGVMNYTDVGHLTSDADEGEDKMAVAAKREQKSPWEIANYYIGVFNADTKKLNIDMPEHLVKATDHIKEMIDFDKDLEQKGYTYLLPDGLYFDVQKFKQYGSLSCKDLSSDKLARIEENELKHHPFDFALWKIVEPNHIMKWNSPWGIGCPGWHIECSAMGRKYLGDKFDLHTGGIDHLSVHHENEIAQNDARLGERAVNYWMHVEFLQVDGGKMGKSLGNLYTLDDLGKRGFEPLDYKYFNFTAHYRKKINFTFDALQSAQSARKSLMEILAEHKKSPEKTDEKIIEQYKTDFSKAINDDLNLPLALGVMWKLVKLPKSIDIYNLALHFDDVFGLELSKETKVEIPKEIEEIAKQRWQAKLSKDWQTADELRSKLTELGWTMKDGKENYQLTKI